MSGHSKWSQIKRKKAVTDNKKGQIFTKLAATIVTAVKEKGKDPKQNLRLKLALEKAKGANMPKESIERAIEKGLGKETSENLESITYEAYGPGGIALLIETITDNKNRISAEIRKILEDNSASLGESGSVKWLFQKNSIVDVLASNKEKNEKIELLAIDLGAENVEITNDIIKIIISPQKTEGLKNILSKKGAKINNFFIGWLPANKIKISNKDKEKLHTLMEELRHNEDVVNIYHNAD